MTTAKTVPHALVSLNLPTSKTPALIAYAQGIIKSMTANAAFPSPTPTLEPRPRTASWLPVPR